MNEKEKKILNDEFLEEVAGGRTFTYEEKQAMVQFNYYFNDRLKSGDLSGEEKNYIVKQIRFYSLYMGLLDRDDTHSYIFDMDKDWEDLYISLRNYKEGR